MSAFRWACFTGDLAAVRQALDDGGAIFDGTGPLPAGTLDPALVDALNLRGDGAVATTGLGHAAVAGHLDVVKLLVARGADAALPTPHGALAPLHLLAASTASIGEGTFNMTGHRDRTIMVLHILFLLFSHHSF